MRTPQVVIAHPSASYFRQLRSELAEQGYAALHCTDCKTLRPIVQFAPPQVLVSELRLCDGPTHALIQLLQTTACATRIIIVTDHDSIASAVRCARLRVAGYYPRAIASKS